MGVRRFGPTLGAGVVVIETPPDKTLSPAPTGITCYVGQTEKGEVGEIIHAPGLTAFKKKLGSYYTGSELPDCAFDFFNLGQGAGQLYVVRVTDGTEVKSNDAAFGRKGGHGFAYGRKADVTWGDVQDVMLTLATKSGGRWGGRERVHTGDVAVVATDITATTLDTASTFLADEWAGATLALEGVTGKTYTVLSNSTAGVLTVESDSTMAADLAAGATPAADGYTLWLPVEELTFPASVAGTKKGLAVVWKNGQEDEDNFFGMELWENGVKVADYSDLSLDPVHKYYIENVVNQDASNEWVDATVVYGGSIGVRTRPSNFSGWALDWSSNILTAQFAHVQSAAFATADGGWIDNWTKPSDASLADRIVPQRLTVTITGSGTTFTVASDVAYGGDHVDLPNGTIGTAYAASNQHTIGFLVHQGDGGLADGDTFVIDVRPFPVDENGDGMLAGGWLYYDIDTNKRSRLRIEDNTNDTITLTSAPAAAPDEAVTATAAGNVTNTGTLTFALTPSADLDVIHSHFGKVTVDVTTNAPFASAAALVAEINTQWQTATSSAGDIATVQTSPADSVDLSTDDGGDDVNAGYDSFLVVETTVANLGVTAGDSALGTLGAEFRVQAPTFLRDGYDGDDPADADYTQHYNTSTSVINRLVGRNLGLVKLATPAKTASAIQKAGLAYAEFANYQYRVEFVDTLDDDSAAVAWINDTIGRNDFGVCSYPSYGYVPNPTGSGLVVRTLTGSIHGREALVAKNYGGYHKAAAGIDVTLPNVAKLPTGERVLSEEVLNPVGIGVIKKVKGNFVIWGDRTISSDPGWRWKHQREQLSHYENIFRDQFDFIVFAINDQITRQGLITTFRAFFLPEWQKRALRGDKFEQAVSIKIDEDNNTNLTAANGDLYADIKLRLADTVERFNIRIGKAGIFEDLG